MKTNNKIILFNPRAVRNKNYRIPNSILQVAASLEGSFEYVIVDGNREKNSWKMIENYIKSGEFKYFGCTVMPGPQLKEAIPITKRIRELYPDMINVWGGYFASNQYEVVVKSDFVDFVINGPGDYAFPALIDALEHNKPYEFIQNLIFVNESGDMVKNAKQALFDQDALPPLPYQALDRFYTIEGYLRPTHLGRQTIAYHSSLGCPFTCSFCAVVPIYEARWKGKSAKSIYADICRIQDRWGGDSIEFHDNNFFVSEKRVVEFSKLIGKHQMNWWGEGRIDTVHKYSDDSLKLMRETGCRMIFFGAESGNDDILKGIDKGGKQNSQQIKEFALRMKVHDIIPEYSFVLGFPAESTQQVTDQVEKEIEFIKEIKEINPDTEIIIYLYSPVPTKDSDLYKQIAEAGFSFPEKLEDWLEPAWENFDLRKNPLTPWLTPEIVDRVKNFETVINAQFPTATDPKTTAIQKWVMKNLSYFRYKFGIYKYPYELKVLQKFWLRYRQPEIEGFASE